MAEKPSPNNIEYYYKHNRFLSLLKTSGKWKDLVLRKEALIAAILAIGSVAIVFNVYKTSITKEFIGIMSGMILNLSSALIGLLGFMVGGIAIISGTISNKIMKNINGEGKFKYLINIVYTFYFAGALVGFTLVIFIFLYLIMQTGWSISDSKVISLGLLSSYFFWFTIIYAVMLLGTCLRLMILSYRFEYDEVKKTEEQ
jgi:hypothetical protein